MSAGEISTEKSSQIKSPNAFIDLLGNLLKNRLAIIGISIIAIQIILAVFAPFIVFYEPTHQNLAASHLKIGSEGHWLGTDQYGRDVWSRLVYGARISLFVGVGATVLGLIGGVALGLISGYYSRLDGIIMRIIDLMFAFPSILLALLIISILGTDLINVVFAISIWTMPSVARLIRGNVLSIKKQEYILALRSMGANDFRIILKHILPNCTAPIIVTGTMKTATAILSTAALSFLGLGAQPPTPEWGAMIADGQIHMWNSPHLVLVPGVAIMLVVFAFNIVGDALRDALDPKMKKI
ncbi:ABC transporter permease [Bacillus sp. JJ1532]|uniref:ABC transporter permease n=1 Tax=unclassified Bacillus (in: firmicutes) TaxID=185979 RepID=UPI002FFEC267